MKMFGSLGSTCTFIQWRISLAEDFHTGKLLESFVGLLIRPQSVVLATILLTRDSIPSVATTLLQVVFGLDRLDALRSGCLKRTTNRRALPVHLHRFGDVS